MFRVKTLYVTIHWQNRADRQSIDHDQVIAGNNANQPGGIVLKVGILMNMNAVNVRLNRIDRVTVILAAIGAYFGP